jgi:hypothetical protein
MGIKRGRKIPRHDDFYVCVCLCVYDAPLLQQVTSTSFATISNATKRSSKQVKKPCGGGGLRLVFFLLCLCIGGCGGGGVVRLVKRERGDKRELAIYFYFLLSSAFGHGRNIVDTFILCWSIKKINPRHWQLNAHARDGGDGHACVYLVPMCVCVHMNEIVQSGGSR